MESGARPLSIVKGWMKIHIEMLDQDVFYCFFETNCNGTGSLENPLRRIRCAVAHDSVLGGRAMLFVRRWTSHGAEISGLLGCLVVAQEGGFARDAVAFHSPVTKIDGLAAL